MESPILVDSNILIFALDSENRKYILARDFLQDTELQLVYAHQNLLETYRVITHIKYKNPQNPNKALDMINKIIEKRVVINPKTETFDIAQKIIKKHSLIGNRIFDAYLAATAISWGINYIATDNEKDFKKFEGIKVLNPFKK